MTSREWIGEGRRAVYDQPQTDFDDQMILDVDCAAGEDRRPDRHWRQCQMRWKMLSCYQCTTIPQWTGLHLYRAQCL